MKLKSQGYIVDCDSQSFPGRSRLHPSHTCRSNSCTPLRAERIPAEGEGHYYRLRLKCRSPQSPCGRRPPTVNPGPVSWSFQFPSLNPACAGSFGQWTQALVPTAAQHLKASTSGSSSASAIAVGTTLEAKRSLFSIYFGTSAIPFTTTACFGLGTAPTTP